MQQQQQANQQQSQSHAAAASQTCDDGATIVATPVLRLQLHADVTRFTPVAVKVKRKIKEVQGKKKKEGKDEADKKASPTADEQDPMFKASIKESAYENFMKEIEELM